MDYFGVGVHFHGPDNWQDSGVYKYYFLKNMCMELSKTIFSVVLFLLILWTLFVLELFQFQL